MAKKSDVVSTDQLKKLGFDVKLTKEDLFDLVIEEMTQKNQARLEQLKQVRVDLTNAYNAFQERLLVAGEAAVKAHPLYAAYVAVFPSAELKDKKLHTPTTYCSGATQGDLYISVEVRDKTSVHTNSAKLALNVPVTDADADEYKRLYARGVAIDNEKRTIADELHSLEHSPRKVKMALLKTMLNGTELGKNLLGMVGNVNKSLSAKALV